MYKLKKRIAKEIRKEIILYKKFVLKKRLYKLDENYSARHGRFDRWENY